MLLLLYSNCIESVEFYNMSILIMLIIPINDCEISSCSLCLLPFLLDNAYVLTYNPFIPSVELILKYFIFFDAILNKNVF